MTNIRAALSILIAIGTLISCAALAEEKPTPFNNNAQPFNYLPTQGVIPNSDVAIQVGTSILTPIYGEARISKEKPFKATLSGDVWVITGTLNRSSDFNGVALIELSKSDGRVLRISHGM
jgi:hypothetical protein